MSKDLKYRVLPQEPKYKKISLTDVSLTEQEKHNVKGLGEGGVMLIGVIALLVLPASGGLATALSDDWYHPNGSIGFIAIIIGWSVLFVASVLIHFSRKKTNILNLERTKAEGAPQRIEAANQMEDQRLSKEANSLTSNLLQTYESSTELATELRQHLNRVPLLLREAENEYHDNAFAPFWDAVENAAQNLAALNEKANRLSGNAKDYYNKLNGRKHTFPAFPVQITTIPDASPVTKEFRRVVRMGQTNHDFADIYEHRRTREVLIAGFRTLGEAVNNLGATLEHSIYILQESVSSDLAKVIEEEIKTRETLDNRMVEQDRMLDNLQPERGIKS